MAVVATFFTRETQDFASLQGWRHCYFEMKNYEKALKAFVLAEKTAEKEGFKPENEDFTSQRIKELKMLLEDDVVQKILESTNGI